MEKVAIIGLACLFPDATTPSEYWQNLLDGRNSISLATAEQMGIDPELFFAPGKGVQDKYYCIHGGYIRDFNFDPNGYQLPADHIDQMDDLFKWSIYVSREALSDSGYLNNSKALAGCGVVLGNLTFPTRSSDHLFASIYKQALEPPLQELLRDRSFVLQQLGEDKPVAPHNMMTFGYPSAFVARALALGQINFSLDAACASSLYAVKVASHYLLTGKTDLMLAGAVSRADPFIINMGFSIFQAYPENGAGNPLNRNSHGLFASEGAGMFLLKRYSDALRDGDRIYAVINGIGLSNDGRGKFLLQPSSKGQIVAFERAYADAGIDPRSIDYLECHATGTPVGDQTELNSMETFFFKHQTAPLIGSVKSNLGHLLTAAGTASMIKVILAMTRRQIPATINLTDPLSSRNKLISAKQMVATTTPWPSQGLTRRAAVSAFGFGGANAHLILEQHPAQHDRKSAALAKNASDKLENRNGMAIVGMDAFFAGCDGQGSFGRTLYDGRQHFKPTPAGRWNGIESNSDILRAYGFENGQPPHGAYLTHFEMDFFHYRIPPDNDRPIAQQLLILKVADRALQDAGLVEGGNVAVIICAGTELSLHRFRGRVDLTWQIRESLVKNGFELTAEQTSELEQIAKDSLHETAQVNMYTSFIGNIMASRVAAQWDFSGPTFAFGAEENSTFKALEVAQMLLTASEVEAALVGAVDLAGGVENVLLRNQMHPVNSGSSTFGIDRQANGWLIGEGAGAVVLKRYEDALEAEDRVYAVVDAVSVVQSPSEGELESSVAQAAREALAATDLSPADIGYLEMYGSGIPAEDEAEIKGLTSAYRADSTDLTCAIGCVKANIGHAFVASGIAALCKTAHCLYHRYIPATPGWSGPKLTELWHKSPFYVAPQSRPWFLAPGADRRKAAISGLGVDGACAHVIASDEPLQTLRPNYYLAERAPTLFPVAANDLPSLLTQLESLRQTIDQNDSMIAAARGNFDAFRHRSDAPLVLSIMGHTKEDALREVQLALETIGKAFETNSAWKTPQGSYFAPKPLARQGKVTFVYPGAFSSYLGLGRDLFHLFPELHSSFASLVPNPGELVGQRALLPRSLSRMSEQQERDFASNLMSDSVTMLLSSMTYSTLVTVILRQQFALHPQAALGYSMGETTMMFALGLWSVQDSNSAYLRSSPLFHNRISGAKNAVREFWGLPSENHESAIEGQNSADIWANYVLRAPAEEVRSLVGGIERVYLTHVNTLQEVVIGGDPQACRQVIEALQCDYVVLCYSDVLHCQPMRSEIEEFKKLNTLPLAGQPSFDLYFSAESKLGRFDSEFVGQAIATGVTQPVNFPQLVNRAYQDGSRIFIELGPRSACTWWMTEILKDRPHLAVGINRRSVDDRTALVAMLAQLVSHGVALDLSPLFKQAQAEGSNARSLVQTVSLLEPSIRDEILTEKNRIKFGRAKKKPEASVLKSIPSESVATTAAAGEGKGQEQVIDLFTTQMSKEQAIEPPPLRAAAPAEPGSNSFNRQLQKLAENVSHAGHVHIVFLRGRTEALRQMHHLISLQMGAPQPLPALNADEPLPMIEVQQQSISKPFLVPAEQPSIPAEVQQRPTTTGKPVNIIWDEDDLLEFAEGRIAPVFGEEYAIIDSYRRRVRLPTPPYLLVSRITEINASRGEFKPSTITTEYDIPMEAWYSTDGQISWAVAVESGQCDLLLISYLGIDFQNKGERVYRLLDCTLIFLDDMPMEGNTLRYDISIDSFAKSGDNLLFFFRYNCFVGDKLVLKMRAGCAGFFSDRELAGGKGIITSAKEEEEKAAIQKQFFEPLLRCERTSFERADILRLSRGEIAEVLGPHYQQQGLNPSLRLPPEGILMLDRIVEIDSHGGAWGLGLIVAEKDLEPDHWYFPCHFVDDQVMAGSLMAEGCCQILQFYFLYLGLQTTTRDARFQPVRDLAQVVRCRRHVTACSSKLIYRMEITEIGLKPNPYAKANVELVFEDQVVVDFKNLGLRLVEKKPDDHHRMPESAAMTVPLRGPPAPASQGSAERRRPGSVDDSIGAGRRCGDKRDLNQLARRPLFDEQHIEEFALGSITACFGPDYQIYEGRRVQRTPNRDLKLISRILESNAERLVFSGQPSLISEYDVPAEPWWLKQNSFPTAPYSILMEMGLQPCGFLSAYLGSTLLFPAEDFHFRNLDGEGILHQIIDLREKTVRNRVGLLSSTSIQGVIIQKYSFQLSVDGRSFYEGTAAFGYFNRQALANQVGLDQGRRVEPWCRQPIASGLPFSDINLKDPVVGKLWFRTDGGNPINTGKPFYRLARNQLNFLDEVMLIPGGGRYAQGYIYAGRKVDPDDWFFACHFHEDPVMPGSLGVEAILQAMHVYALHQNLGAELKSPQFTHIMDHQTVWTYRGQITPADNAIMHLEIHISRIRTDPDQVTVVGDASLWKDQLRIYEVKQVGFRLVES